MNNTDCRIGSSTSYLEKRILDIRKTQDADVDKCLLLQLLIVEQCSERIDCSAGLRDNLAHDVDVDVGAAQHILVPNEGDEPTVHLEYGDDSALGPSTTT